MCSTPGERIRGQLVARYRKVSTRIWNDEAFMSLSDDGQLTFIFVLTHPQMTSLGAMRTTIPGLAAEKRWAPIRFRRALEECISHGMVDFDERSCFIALPNFFKYNQPESANVVKSWGEIMDRLPECPARKRMVERAVELAEGLPEGLKLALPETFRRLIAFPDPDPDPESSPRTRAGARRPLKPQAPIPDTLADLPFQFAWQEFRDYRAYEKRKPMSKEAEGRMLAKLEPFGAAVAIAALRESMVNEWQGVFPEKVSLPAERRNGRADRQAAGLGPADTRQQSDAEQFVSVAMAYRDAPDAEWNVRLLEDLAKRVGCHWPPTDEEINRLSGGAN